MRTVKNILSAKPAPSNIVSPDTIVLDGLNLLNTVNLSYLIVKKDDRFLGIFSERDYSRNVILKGKSSTSAIIAEVMSTDFPVVHLSDTVEHCMNALNAHKTRYLLAYDPEEKFLGVITIHDLMRQVLSSREDVFDTAAQQWLDQDESGDIY